MLLYNCYIFVTKLFLLQLACAYMQAARLKSMLIAVIFYLDLPKSAKARLLYIVYDRTLTLNL